MSSIPASHHVTPNRVSHIRFDVPDQALVQPPFSMIRMGNEIARGPDSEISFVRYLQNIGWELEAYQVSLGFKHERSEAVAGNQLPSAGLMTVAASHVEVPLFAKPVDLNGSDPSWYDANVVDSGDVFIQKRVGAGDSFEQRLSSDQSAFPGSTDPNGDNVAMDRVAKGNNHNLEPVIFSFIAPTSLASAPHKFAHFYFTGPAGSGNKWRGKGQYEINFYGDGKCILKEKVRFDGESNDEWFPVHTFQYAPAYSVGGQAHRIEIRPVAMGILVYAPYGAICFDVKVDTQASYSAGPGLMASGYTRKPGRTSQSTYILSRTATRKSSSPPAVEVAPTRVDIRRDKRVPFQVTKLVYRTSGHLIDDPFSLDFWPTAELDLTVALFGSIPSGTSLTPRLFRVDNGTEIIASSTTASSAVFHLPERVRHYKLRIDFAGTSDTTPILEGYQARMDGVIATIDPGEFEPEVVGLNPGALMSVSITGAEADPSHESMSIVLDDLMASLPRVRKRGMMLAQLETEYDPEDPDKRCILFRGHLASNENAHKGHGVEEGQFPDRDRKGFDLSFMGVWKRLSEALSTVRFDWHGPDPDAAPDADGIQPPFKATYAIRTMFGWAGFDASMLNIPDLPTRLYPSTTNDLFIEPLANLADYIFRIARDYLAMWITFDPNASTYGKWTLLGTPTAPYTNVAAFVTEGPDGKLAHVLDGYPTDPPTAFIAKGTFHSHTRPLEANRLVVTGTGILAGSPPELEKLTQVFYNLNSFNAFNLDPDHPAYPDPEHPDYCTYDKPLYVVDPSLQTEEAVNLVGRRIFDVACLSTRIASFMAPLLLIDHETEVGKKRPLRFYDPVTITMFGETTQWLVRNVNPAYTKDSMQMATYELEAPREPFLVY